MPECPVHCNDEAKADGFNLFCNHDKTSGSKEGNYVHLTSPLDFLLKKMKKIQARALEGTERNGDKEWYTRDDTCFFLNSKGSTPGSAGC